MALYFIKDLLPLLGHTFGKWGTLVKILKRLDGIFAAHRTESSIASRLVKIQAQAFQLIHIKSDIGGNLNHLIKVVLDVRNINIDE